MNIEQNISTENIDSSIINSVNYSQMLTNTLSSTEYTNDSNKIYLNQQKNDQNIFNSNQSAANNNSKSNRLQKISNRQRNNQKNLTNGAASGSSQNLLQVQSFGYNPQVFFF